MSDELTEQLKDPEFIEQQIRRRVARCIIVIESVEDYAGKQNRSGIPIDEIPIMQRWGGWQNTAIKALMSLHEQTEKQAEPMNVTQALESMVVKNDDTA